MATRSDKPECKLSMQTDPEKRAVGNRGSANKDEMDQEDPTQGIPDWSQPFTDNLEDMETHVPAHSYERENSDSEGAAKVVTNWKHSIEIHFTNDRNCDVCLRTKITRVPRRRRDEGSIPRAVKFGDLITADHKILNEGNDPGTITDTLSWYKISPLNGYNLIRVKPTKVHGTVAEAKSYLH